MTSPNTTPVQTTNIIKLNQEHVPIEIAAVEKRLVDLLDERVALDRYLDTLRSILDAIGDGDD